jgi:hypothetical protein
MKKYKSYVKMLRVANLCCLPLICWASPTNYPDHLLQVQQHFQVVQKQHIYAQKALVEAEEKERVARKKLEDAQLHLNESIQGKHQAQELYHTSTRAYEEISKQLESVWPDALR